MMKKTLRILLLSALALVSAIFVVSCGGAKEKYFLKAEFKNVAIDGNTVKIEYGNSFTVPAAAVTDDGGEEYEVDIKWKLVSASGEDITKTSRLFFLETGEYTLTFSASAEGTTIKDLVYKVVCADTLAPEITVGGLLDTYTVGDSCTVMIQNIKDASDIDDTKTYIKAYKGDEEIAVENGVVTFATAGQYKIVVSATDNVGNVGKVEIPVIAVGEYEEPAADHTIWGFESEESVAVLRASSSSEEFGKSITAEKAATEGGKSLKLGITGMGSAIIDRSKKIDFRLVGGNKVKAGDAGSVIFRVYAEKLVDDFIVYTATDNMLIFDAKVGKGKWIDLSFDPETYYDKDAYIDEFRVQIIAEEDVTLYIDGVYYTDYVEPWHDENLEEGVYADFNEAEYAARVSSVTGADYSTPGGVWEVLPAGSDGLPAGTNGGALKFTSTVDATTTGSAKGRDGFYYKLVDNINVSELSGIKVRVDLCGNPFTVMSCSFVTDFGTTVWPWVSLSPKAGGGYQDVIVHLADIKSLLDDAATVIKGIHFRFHKNCAEEISCYIDEICPAGEKDAAIMKNEILASGKYGAATDVDVLDNALFEGLVTDGLASGGKAVKATTAYGQNSGIAFYYDNIDVTAYSKIIIVLRLGKSNSICVNVNGEYRKYLAIPADGYAELNLFDYLKEGETTLSEISITRTQVAGIEIYIDRIEFVAPFNDYASLDYDFSASDDEDIYAADVANGAYGLAIVEDAIASDGYAVKATTAYGMDSGIVIRFDDLDVSDYSAIKVYVRLGQANSVGLYINGEYRKFLAFSADSYTEINVLEYIKEGETTLSEISIARTQVAGIQIYVDKVVFIAAE